MYINLPTSDTKKNDECNDVLISNNKLSLETNKKTLPINDKNHKQKVTGKYYVIKQNEVVILLLKKLKEII